MSKFEKKINRTKERQIAEYYVYNDSTVRKTAQHFGISKSYAHKVLVEFQQNKPTSGTQLALEVAEQCNKNVQARAIRGGQSTKIKYSKKTN